MGLILLEGMEFFAYHGHFDEEQKIGNKYAIDVEVDTDLSNAAASDKLKDTINYGEIYEKVALVMKKKHRLLEHVAYDIIEEIKSKFNNINSIKVSVSKFNPPIGGVCEKAKVIISG